MYKKRTKAYLNNFLYVLYGIDMAKLSADLLDDPKIKAEKPKGRVAR